jgi:spermidine/putrescine transport system ATP-binding protein
MSDRIAVMHRGKVLQEGSPTEIYERPNCRFVADFIGETNFLGGVVQEQEGKRVRVLVDGRLPVTVEADHVVERGREVTVAVRPEKVRLLLQPAEGEHNSLRCHVEQVVYVGNDTRFHVRVSDQVALVIRQQNIIFVPESQGYQADRDKPTYAVWRHDAGRLLLD